jgi:light-independent protochlorophyllide reductase subunit B
MFREDFEFHATAPASHLGRSMPHAPAVNDAEVAVAVAAPEQTPVGEPSWAADALAELQKIPFFVRGKARRNTERFAQERGVPRITVETLYDAKAHFAR